MTASKWKKHLSAADRRAKTVIEACVANGAGIEYLPDAPRFRFTPLTVEQMGITSFKGRECRGPSSRGTINCGCGNPLNLKNWSPVRLSLNPVYFLPMAGDPSELTKACAAWAGGDPGPLQEYLAAQAVQAPELEYDL